jgi:ABC-type enterobactin transport system permease subunit
MEGPAQVTLLTLTQAELVLVTGFKRPQDQVRFIRENYGIRAVVNGLNECIVVRAHLEAAARPEENATPRKRIRGIK